MGYSQEEIINAVQPLPLIWPGREATSEIADVGLIFVREIGVNGGEETSSVLSGFWEKSKSLDTCIVVALWLLDGMEKLLDTGGVGNGEATFDVIREVLFVAENSFLDINGAE